MTPVQTTAATAFKENFTTLQEFVREYPKYTSRSVAMYSLYRDVCLNSDVDVTEIQDIGTEYVINNDSQYMITSYYGHHYTQAHR